MKTSILPLALCLFLSGCSWINMFKGPEDYARNWYASDLKRTYDSSIAEELKKVSPSGHATKPYHPDLWVEYWNDRIYYILEGEMPEGYVGPTQKEWVDYIITERRKVGLSELEYNQRTKAMIEPVDGINSVTLRSTP